MTGPPASIPRDARLPILADPAAGPDRPRGPCRAALARLRSPALVLVALGLSAYPPVSMPLGCVVWGWEGVLVARWLRRADPVAARGRSCFWSYLAWALWRMTLMAVAMMFAIIVARGRFEERGGRRGDAGPPPEFMACLLAATVGLALSTAASAFAAASAVRHRVRVWVGPEPRWARSDGAWPPQFARRRGTTTNRARRILLAALITGSMPGLTALLIASISFVPGGMTSPILAFAITLGFLIGSPILIMVLLEWLGRRIIASSPSECWSRVVEGSSGGR